MEGAGAGSAAGCVAGCVEITLTRALSQYRRSIADAMEDIVLDLRGQHISRSHSELERVGFYSLSVDRDQLHQWISDVHQSSQLSFVEWHPPSKYFR